jgi:hemolysin-activating ACP:hemolysin acyltransferase
MDGISAENWENLLENAMEIAISDPNSGGKMYVLLFFI